MAKLTWKTTYTLNNWVCEIGAEDESLETLKEQASGIIAYLDNRGATPYQPKTSSYSGPRKKKEPDYVENPETKALHCLHILKDTTATCNAVGTLADGTYGQWFKCPNYRNHADYKPKEGG